MNLCIIGCGNMGLIYSRFFTEQQIVKKENLLLIEKNDVRREELKQKNIGNIEVATCKQIESSDVILIAVKPQDYKELAQLIKGRLNKNAIVISIMAGITIGDLESSLAHNLVVRAMPNAPALYAKGMTVYCLNNGFDKAQQEQVAKLLAVTGKIQAIEKEELLDAVTALSGSGPAYFFYLAQQMIKAAQQVGMDAKMAEVLVKQTLVGAAEMLDKSDKTTAELIKTVASRGGTTEAALTHFALKEMDQAVIVGIEKATHRSKELAQNN